MRDAPMSLDRSQLQGSLDNVMVECSDTLHNLLHRLTRDRFNVDAKAGGLRDERRVGHRGVEGATKRGDTVGRNVRRSHERPCDRLR